MRLLSVDWDAFFPVHPFDSDLWALYDWSHQDGGSIFGDSLWYTRASGFLQNGLPLPLTSGEESSFWSRCTFNPRARLFTADSHSQIYTPRVRSRVASVVNFDAHHDAGYKLNLQEWLERATVTCEDWAVGYQMDGVEVTTVYPRWKPWGLTHEPDPTVPPNHPILSPVRRVLDDGRPLGHFDRVFLCRSGGWTPPWLDDAYQAFVESCPVKPAAGLEAVADRGWDLSYLTQLFENSLRSMQGHPEFASMIQAYRRGLETLRGRA